MARPDARVAVGLQLGPHRAAGRSLLAGTVAEGAELVLRVVAVHVRQHVRLAARADRAVVQLGERPGEAAADRDPAAGQRVAAAATVFDLRGVEPGPCRNRTEGFRRGRERF